MAWTFREREIIVKNFRQVTSELTFISDIILFYLPGNVINF